MDNENVLEIWRTSHYKIMYLWIQKKKIQNGKWVSIIIEHVSNIEFSTVFTVSTLILPLSPYSFQCCFNTVLNLRFRDPRAHTQNSGVSVNRKKNTSLFLLTSAWASLSIMKKRKENNNSNTCTQSY